MENTEVKKTPLYNCHVEAGAKPVPFAGYFMPIQYPEGIVKEHMRVRTKAGLFDVSHMGELFFTGKDALTTIQHLLTNNFENLEIGQIRYSPMCNDTGGIVDDLMVQKLADNRYLMIVNAANRYKDVAWIKGRLVGDTEFVDASDDWAEIAIQGPESIGIIARLANDESIPKKYYHGVEKSEVGGIPVMLAKTGYTGELGYELYCSNEDAEKLWNLLLREGTDVGLAPCGLGCRDTLRLEASMPLYGHEMTDDISPIETGLSRFVDMGKDDFIGKEALIARGEPKQIRVGLKMLGRGIAREHYPVFAGEREIGFIMSGSHLPFLGAAYATAFIDVDQSEIGTIVQVIIREKPVDAEVVEMPFYKRPK